MKFFIDDKRYIETNSPLDISIGLSNTDENLRAWYVEQPSFDPVMEHGFVGSVAAGGNVNFRNIFFNPHGHGTHTECLGHITPEVFSVNQSLKSYFFFAEVISVNPAEVFNQDDQIWDKVILKEQLELLLKGKQCEALVIRTLPNEETKKHLNYSSMNATYLDVNCLDVINEIGCKHLLVDLPSVDRESDGGKLSFHHAFWQVPENPQFDKTITEFVYVDETITDGSYVLELQTAPFENDAAPSRPVLYRIEL